MYLLHRLGCETGVDLETLVDAGLLAQRLLGRKLPGRSLQACAARRPGPAAVSEAGETVGGR